MSNIPFKNNSIILAPMAGVTDSGFRIICKKYGADAVFSEMVSSKGLYYKDKKSFELINYYETETPISIQIFGSDTECMKKAAEYITKNFTPASIDINMGCPAPKIFSNGDGCALMGDIEKAYEVIVSVKNNTNIPVSVKFRSGITSDKINAVEFAKMCESAKADFITVHARTRDKFYSGKADLNVIKDVINNVTIPVIANGDIIDGASAIHALDYTGAHSVMIGRGALGNPLVFNKIKSQLGFEEEIKTEKFDIFDIALEHLSLTIQNKGELLAVKEFRKHLMWYLKGFKNATKLKQMSCTVNTYLECKQVFELAKKENRRI